MTTEKQTSWLLKTNVQGAEIFLASIKTYFLNLYLEPHTILIPHYPFDTIKI